MSINIYKNLTYAAEKNHYHNTPIHILNFFVKAMFHKNIPHISSSIFHGKPVELDDITYFTNDGKPDFMYIIKVDELKYLVDSSFSVVSDGYHQIVQLHNKIPKTNGYIVVKKSEKDNTSHLCCGLLNNNGKELISCKYRFIHPITCKTVLHHDADYIGGLSDHLEEILLFECKSYRHGYDLYTYDGTLVLENICGINKTEEKIYYKYNYYDCGMYTETKVLEKIEITLGAPSTDSSLDYPVRYAYQVNSDEKYAELQYMGMEEEDRLYLEAHHKEHRSPETSLPKTIRIEIYTEKDDVGIDKEFICDFLKKATEDISIYNYIEANDVNFHFKRYFPTKFGQCNTERETNNLKDKKSDDIIDILCETIDCILGTNSKKALTAERKKQAEIRHAEWLKEKIKHQSQITLDTKLADCYFGDYDMDCVDITVREFTALNGEDVFRSLSLDKKLFEEIVTVLLSHHIYFADYSPTCDIQTYFKKTYDAYEKHKKDILSQSINELNLTPRTRNCLARQNIHTIEDLTRYTLDEIKVFRNMGERALAEILQKLNDFGFSLKQE